MTTTPDLTDLDHDGATVDLPDGRTLRVRVETDHDTTIDDFDCYGQTAWVEYDRDTGSASPRPDGFDGRARKLHAYGGDAFWWQPPFDMGMADDPETVRKNADLVVDLVSFGFKGVILEMLDGEDAYGSPIVRGVASVWGVDDTAEEYVRDLVGELATELLDD